MKSSVINSGNGTGGPNNPQQQPQTAAPQNSVNTDGNNNPQCQQGQNARYPFFDFEMDDPRDFFTNPALRSRLSRMRNPWGSSMGFAPQQRKRPNQGPEEEDSGFVEDPHESFFSKFDPHWGDHGGQWPRSTLRKRHPADFGGHSDFFDYFPSEFRQYIPDDFGFHHPPMSTMPPAQQRPTAPQQQAPQHQMERPRFCDAAMQTDDEPPTPQEENTQTDASVGGSGVSAPLTQHGMRNTVDLGQKSPPEERAERAKSAPPEAEPVEATAGTAPQPDPTGLHPPPSPTQNVRHIPIIVERSNKAPAPPQPPKRAVSQKKFVLKPQGVSAADAGTSTTQTPTSESVPEPEPQPEAPPTPSAESIAKIQQIQKEVLELMFRVEAFQGNSRTDKEYLFLDEMLTRNLLKLDTIDTKGNESIRLARREAIKCIQASLSVLEAKADGLKSKPEDTEKAVVDSTADESTEKSEEKLEVTQEGSEVTPENAEVVDKSKIPIPLPPIEPKQPEEVSKSEEENDKQQDQSKDDTKTTKKKKIVVKKVNKNDNTENESTAQNENPQA